MEETTGDSVNIIIEIILEKIRKLCLTGLRILKIRVTVHCGE